MTRAILLIAALMVFAACKGESSSPRPPSDETATPTDEDHDTDPPSDGTDPSPAAVETPELSSDVYRSTLDLVALQRQGRLDDTETSEITVEDPTYGTEKRYEGWPLDVLLEQFADLPDDPDGYIVQFVATDGYRATAPLDELPVDEGVVAFRDLEAPDDRPWLSFTHGDDETTPAPFYAVWPTSDGSDDHGPWAYKLAKIAIARADNLWGDAVPDHDEDLRAGFAVFRTHCMKCHAVNRSGGSVGPELNVPMNVTEYWRPEHLSEFIREPSSYRAGTQMPSMDGSLTDEDMAALLGYLRGMAEAKICESVGECREMGSGK